MNDTDSLKAKISKWGENDSLIMADRCDVLDCPEEHPLCELCERKLVALPESVEKCRRADFHLLCRNCAGLVATQADIRFCGRYDTSEKARTILPQD